MQGHWPSAVDVREPPFLREAASAERSYALLCLAAAPVIVTGAVLFGYGVLALYVSGALGALLADRMGRALIGHGRRAQYTHAVAMSIMLTMTLPPTVGLAVPFLGSFLGVALGKWLLGGLGHYLWHPALVGRAALAMLFPTDLSPFRWSFLAKGHQVSGWLEAASAGAGYRGFSLTPAGPGYDAWSMPRPIDWIIRQYASAGDTTGAGSLIAMFRDHLPPWSDTLWGVVGGGVGETCSVVIVACGLLLVYFRVARWQLPAAALVTVAILAATWPIPGGAGPNASLWFPILREQDGLNLGAATVLFHLTGGGLLLAVFVVAHDPVSTPLSGRGHAIFGIGVGALTFAARVNGLSPGGVYWAVLAMNTLVPLIDRLTRRRVYGT